MLLTESRVRDAIRDLGARAQTLTLVADEYARGERHQGDVDDCVEDMRLAIVSYEATVRLALQEVKDACLS